MTVATEKVAIECTECHKRMDVKPTKRGNPRPPKGWKRFAERLLCTDCKAKLFKLRAVTFPIASVIEGGTWQEFGEALRRAWQRSTRLANWAVRQLFAADRERTAGDEKLYALDRIDLYKLWTEHYHERSDWAGASTAANAILHAVEQKYRKKRFNVIWLNGEQLPRMTYPQPYPVHNQSWKAEYLETDGGRIPVVKLTIDGVRWVIKLRGGHERGRQLKSFAQMVSGVAETGELAIYRQRSYGSHRRTVRQAGNGGAVPFTTRIMVKLVAYLPRPKNNREAKGTLEVRTGKKALLVAMNPNAEKPWIYHAFQLRRAIYAYDKRREMVANDLKAERRPASPHLREWQQRAATKMNRRIDSECRMIAAMVVKYAVRQGLAAVSYTDNDRRYFDRFDWGKLRLYLEMACEEHGLQFTEASEDVVDDDSQPEPESPQ